MRLSATSLRVLAALLSETQEGRHPTERDLARLLGWRGSPQWVNSRLHQLEAAGLVSNVSGRGTLRPTCRMFIYEGGSNGQPSKSV